MILFLTWMISGCAKTINYNFQESKSVNFPDKLIEERLKEIRE